MDPKPSGDALAGDAGILIYPQAGVDAQPLFASSAEIRFLAMDLASTLMNLIPYFGQLKGAVEGALGKDLVSGRNLAGWERALNLASAVPHLHGHSVMTRAVVDIGHTAHQANTLVHANHAVGIYGGSGSGQGGSQPAPAQGGSDPLQSGTGRLQD